MKLPQIFLASFSPRRHEILRRIGIPFKIVERESFDTGEISRTNPAKYAEKIAQMKAQRAILPSGAQGIVLAFDTIVSIENEILGKPRDITQAKLFLKKLSGKWHIVYTGVAAKKADDERIISAVEGTKVLFSQLTDREIDEYIASEEPMDKAGAYGIQELGALLVRKVDGCFYNVVGLPLLCLTEVLAQLKIKRIFLMGNISNMQENI